MKKISAVLLDLSGVLYVGDSPIEGARETIRKLEEAKIPFRLITNTTRTTRQQITAKLQSLGFDFPQAWIFTPPIAVKQYLRRHNLKPHLLVHPNLESEFSEFKQGDDVVVMGDAGKYFTYANLNAAFRVLKAGSDFIAMGDNRYFREPDGLSLDIGPFVKALEYACDCEATIIGKPARRFFLEAVSALDVPAEEVLMVGDDVLSDVKGALDAGLQAALVKTGKYQPEDEKRLTGSRWYLLENIGALPQLLETNRD